MNDETETLFDACLALRMEWEAVAEQYRSTLASHLRLCMGPGSLPPGEFARVAADLIRYSSASEQLSKCSEMLDEVLGVAEEIRVNSSRVINSP
jgi:hypothetical protein